MAAYLFLLVLFVKTSFCNHFENNISHMEFYKNRTRPSKSFQSFSSNYFSQNSVQRGEKVQCGTRIVNFNPQRLAKIVGGMETPYGAFPWQAEIQMLNMDNYKFEHHCGGAVISDRLIVSAAHCFDIIPLNLDHFRIVLGKHRLNNPDSHENRFQLDKIVSHNEFRKNGPHSNDIALMIVKMKNSKGIQFNTYVRPICLPESTVPAGQWCTVSGWGYQLENNNNFAPALRAASVPVMDLATCRKKQVLGGRQQAILDTMICAGVLGGGVDACSGDSGGPLACLSSNRYQLRGIVSWGSGCARKAKPGVYTRVASYVHWIKSIARMYGVSLP